MQTQYYGVKKKNWDEVGQGILLLGTSMYATNYKPPKVPYKKLMTEEEDNE